MTCTTEELDGLGASQTRKAAVTAVHYSLYTKVRRLTAYNIACLLVHYHHAEYALLGQN
jgi:hypothetical protein